MRREIMRDRGEILGDVIAKIVVTGQPLSAYHSH